MESATQTLHRFTSYGPYDDAHAWDPPVDDPRVVRDLVANDLDRLPWFYKRYPQSLPRVRLPVELAPTTAAAVDVLAGTASVARVDLSLPQLSRILHLSAGVVRTAQRSYGLHLFRAAGSAGGRFPLEVYLAVPEGGAVPAGVYRWPDLSAPVRTGELREELYHVCSDQSLGRDAAFVVVAATDLGAVDDRQYREAQLAAGIVEGRLHLLAYALGASASGMTFADSLLPGLLGQPVDGLLFTCVGVPEYTSAAGGMPGAAVSIRMVTPRM